MGIVIEVYRRFWRKWCLHLQGRRVNQASRDSSLAEVYRSFRGTSLHFYQTTRRHIQDDSNLIVTAVGTSW
jgi:hypothetical protein